MTCHNCRVEAKRHGRDRKGNQRYKCQQCSKTFLEPQDKPLGGMYLPIEKAEMVLRLLLEGNSVSSTSRLTGRQKSAAGVVVRQRMKAQTVLRKEGNGRGQ